MAELEDVGGFHASSVKYRLANTTHDEGKGFEGDTFIDFKDDCVVITITRSKNSGRVTTVRSVIDYETWNSIVRLNLSKSQ